MKGLNRVQLIGYIGSDPKVDYNAGHNARALLNVATGYNKKKQDGTYEECTDWHRVVFFNRQAEFVGKLLKKGAKVFIEGALKTRSYEKAGVKHYITEVVGFDFQVLGGNSDNHELSTSIESRLEKQEVVDIEEFDIPF